MSNYKRSLTRAYLAVNPEEQGAKDGKRLAVACLRESFFGIGRKTATEKAAIVLAYAALCESESESDNAS